MHSALKHFTRHFKEPCSCRQKSLSATYQQQKLSQVWERERKPNHRCFKIFSVPGPVLCITLMPCLCGENHSNFALKNALASFCKVNVNSVFIEKGTGVCTQSSCCPTHRVPQEGVPVLVFRPCKCYHFTNMIIKMLMKNSLP